jgi:hypothetical protein
MVLEVVEVLVVEDEVVGAAISQLVVAGASINRVLAFKRVKVKTVPPASLIHQLVEVAALVVAAAIVVHSVEHAEGEKNNADYFIFFKEIYLNT